VLEVTAISENTYTKAAQADYDGKDLLECDSGAMADDTVR